MRAHRPSAAHPHSHGFTLLEVLVALVIFSVGLLGLAGLQMSSVRSNSSAQYRTQATLVLQDLAERMHANTAAVGTNTYSGIDFTTIDCTAPPTPYCADSGGTAAAACSPQEMASFDGWMSFCMASNALPGAALAINASGTLRTLTVNWNEPAAEGGVDAKSVAMTLQP